MFALQSLGSKSHGHMLRVTENIAASISTRYNAYPVFRDSYQACRAFRRTGTIPYIEVFTKTEGVEAYG